MSLIVAAAASASLLLPMLQSRMQYCDEGRRNIRHRVAELDLMKQHHDDNTRLARMHFDAEADHTLIQDLERYHVRLTLSRRQTVRDAWHQRFLTNQTLLLVIGVMLGCAFCAIGQGQLPSEGGGGPPPETSMLYAFGLSSGVAVALLIMALWACLKVQGRMHYFDPNSTSIAPPPTQQRHGATRGEAGLSFASNSAIGSAGAYHCGHRHPTFNEYYNCHCENVRWWSVMLLYFGSCAVLVCGVILVKMTTFQQDNVSVVIIGVVIGVGALLVMIGEVVVPDRTTDEASRHDYGGVWQALEMEKKLEVLLDQHRWSKRQQAAPFDASDETEAVVATATPTHRPF